MAGSFLKQYSLYKTCKHMPDECRCTHTTAFSAQHRLQKVFLYDLRCAASLLCSAAWSTHPATHQVHEFVHMKNRRNSCKCKQQTSQRCSLACHINEEQGSKICAYQRKHKAESTQGEAGPAHTTGGPHCQPHLQLNQKRRSTTGGSNYLHPP